LTIKARSKTIVIFAHLIQAASALPTDFSALESSISALETEIEALETKSIFWEHLVLWFTALVVIGVAMEFWVICRERRDDMGAWRRGVIIPPERPSTAKFIIELVSLVLITGGIFGELGVGIKVTSINGVLRGKSAELRSKSNQLVALVNERAASAEKRAGEAELELALIKTARSITHKSELIASLGSFKGTKYMFFGLFGDEESTNLLKEIDSVLQQAKWTRAQPRTPFPPVLGVSLGNEIIAVTNRFDTGVKIGVIAKESLVTLNSLPPEKRPPQVAAATALLQLTRSIFPPQKGIGQTVDVKTANDEGIVLVTVGKHP
jgi:hypothetical protein